MEKKKLKIENMSKKCQKCQFTRNAPKPMKTMIQRMALKFDLLPIYDSLKPHNSQVIKIDKIDKNLICTKIVHTVLTRFSVIYMDLCHI